MAMTDDELLSPTPAIPNSSLKTELLARTERRVRLFVWHRRGMVAVACFACFALGWATTYMRSLPEQATVYVEVPISTPVADASGSASPQVKLRSPAELELEAEQIVVKAEAARRFREAGDRYFRDFADYRGALRCYRNFLDEADPTDLQVTPDDTWLLTSLKRAREQENPQ
jgi:hypothetical protein